MNKVILIITIIILIFKTETLFSANIVYDVNNIKIIGKITTDKDRERLIERGYRKAFNKFINKTLLQKDIDRLQGITINEIKDLIFSYQISENELTSKKENKVLLNVKFHQKKITNFLILKGISYSDVSDISLIIFPVLVTDKEVFLYSDNFFYKNWHQKEYTEQDSFITYNLALESIEDLEYIISNKDNLESINIEKLVESYENKDYAIIVIYFSNKKLRAFIKTSIQKKEIIRNIKLKFDVKNRNESFALAIIDIKKEIKQIWKSQNLVDFSTPSFLDFSVDFSNINDFLKIKNILDKIQLIDNYSVLELTNNYAKLRIKYNGKIIKLKDKFRDQGVKVDINENKWKLSIK